MISIKTFCQSSRLLQAHLIKIYIFRFRALLFKILNGLLLHYSYFFLIIFMELVNNEPGRYGSRICIHVEKEQRTTHGQYLDYYQRTQSEKVMINADQIIPVFRSVLLFRLLFDLQVQVTITSDLLQCLFCYVSEHSPKHSYFLPIGISKLSSYFLDIFFANVVILNGVNAGNCEPGVDESDHKLTNNQNKLKNQFS